LGHRDGAASAPLCSGAILVVKEHKDSTRRIDLAEAAVMAFAAASTVEPGPQLFVFDE